MKNALKLTFILAMIIALSTIGPFQPSHSFAQDPSTVRDGRHDFDFSVGKWKTHISQLVHPLSHSDGWVKLEGEVTTRSIGDGKAFLEEIEAGNTSGHLKELPYSYIT